jgi:O-6-methylguanine DNA methyltransferase
MQKEIIVKFFITPVGEMMAAAVDEGLCLFDFKERKMIGTILSRLKKQLKGELKEGEHCHFKELNKQIKEYFEGNRQEFQLPLIFTGTDFQKRVWESLQKIPYGAIRSYKQQAMALGDLKVIRAVAAANGKNCFAIIVPCHRVIAENGNLTGYAGGLAKKKWLLNFEKNHSLVIHQTSLFE